MSEPKVSEVLMLAKDKIIDGWVPHCPRVSREETCAIAAIGTAYEELARSGFSLKEETYQRFFEDAIGTPGHLVASWSDSGPKQKVIDGFDAAIRLAKEREQS